jgi:hypothetical protein
MDNKTETDTSQYPSIDLAYDHIESSYSLMLSRFEAANSRLVNLMTWAVGITFAIPLFVKSIFNANFNSGWLYASMATFVLLFIVGIIAQSTGSIKLIHPETLYNKWLTDSPWEFKKNLLYFSGQHFNANNSNINRKCVFISIMNALLAVEVILAVIWIITSL